MNLTTEKSMATKSNAAETDRNFTIRGDVYTDKNGAFEAVRNGQVYSKDDGAHLAWFSAGVSEPLSINFSSPDTGTATETSVISDIQAFIAAAKAVE